MKYHGGDKKETLQEKVKQKPTGFVTKGFATGFDTGLGCCNKQ